MSIVIDELEDAVLATLPGDTPAENAEYLRELAYRLTLTADDLDPEPSAPATTATAATAPTVLVTGNPVDGIRLTGPFPTDEDAYSYADQARLGEWWATTLDRPTSTATGMAGDE